MSVLIVLVISGFCKSRLLVYLLASYFYFIFAVLKNLSLIQNKISIKAGNVCNKVKFRDDFSP